MTNLGFLGGKGQPRPAPTPPPRPAPAPAPAPPPPAAPIPDKPFPGDPPSSIEEALAMCDSLPAEDQDVCRVQISQAAARDSESAGGSKKPLIIGLLVLLLGGLGIMMFLKRKKAKAPKPKVTKAPKRRRRRSR